MKVDALLITEGSKIDRQPYSRFYVLDSRWILRIQHYNYEDSADSREYDFEEIEEAQKRILYYLNALDSKNRTLHIYQDELDLFSNVDEMEMEVDRYWF